jgi:hypothetical protein
MSATNTKDGDGDYAYGASTNHAGSSACWDYAYSSQTPENHPVGSQLSTQEANPEDQGYYGDWQHPDHPDHPDHFNGFLQYPNRSPDTTFQLPKRSSSNGSRETTCQRGDIDDTDYGEYFPGHQNTTDVDNSSVTWDQSSSTGYQDTSNSQGPYFRGDTMISGNRTANASNVYNTDAQGYLIPSKRITHDYFVRCNEFGRCQAGNPEWDKYWNERKETGNSGYGGGASSMHGESTGNQAYYDEHQASRVEDRNWFDPNR